MNHSCLPYSFLIQPTDLGLSVENHPFCTYLHLLDLVSLFEVLLLTYFFVARIMICAENPFQYLHLSLQSYTA